MKHALALRFTYPDRAVTLLYLYWEPDNPEALPQIAVNRREITDFSRRVAGDRIAFTSLSYPALWRDWSTSGVGWIEAHTTQLVRRYGVAV